MIQTKAYAALSENSELMPWTFERRDVGVQHIHTAFDRMQKGDVRYRFVIDMSTL